MSQFFASVTTQQFGGLFVSDTVGQHVVEMLAAALKAVNRFHRLDIEHARTI